MLASMVLDSMAEGDCQDQVTINWGQAVAL